MTLGLMGGIGLVILIFGFGLKPGKPPVDVILTIMAVVCASSCLQATGGLDCLLQIAEKALRRHPRAVCYLRSVHLLVPDRSLRYGPRRVHDAPDYLRRCH
ncbi:MAG: anaerobic C4-dicarboxylate transporter family protein [Duodenibacillus massiliensis]